MLKQRPRKVTGYAATELLEPNDPNSPRNRRISVILLRGDYLDLDPSEMPATRELLSVPTPRVPEVKSVEEEAPKAEPTITPAIQPKEADIILPGQQQIPADSMQTPPNIPQNAPANPQTEPVINPDVKASKEERRLLQADPSEFMDE